MVAWNVIHRDSVESTMDEIDALAEMGAPEGTVVSAFAQTQGRGRSGRSWTAKPGSSLFISALYRPSLALDKLSSLSIVVGIALADAIDQVTGLSSQLKWPNDVLIGGKKVAGILIATKFSAQNARYTNIGIGVNCLSEADDLPLGAASLLSASGREIEPFDLLGVLLERLDLRLGWFECAGGRPMLDDWIARAAFRGERVRVEEGGVNRVGILSTIDPDGALILLNEQGREIKIVSGDVTRGPRPAGAS